MTTSTQEDGDLVERLREMLSPNGTPHCVALAADEIERLRSALSGLVALRTEVACRSWRTWSNGEWVWNDDIWRDADPDEFEAVSSARTALSKARGGE